MKNEMINDRVIETSREAFDKILPYGDYAIEAIINYTPKLFLAAFTLFVGLRIIETVQKTFVKISSKKKIDVSLRGFVSSFLGVALKILLVLSVISMIGIEVTSFVAILGAASLAIGMALSGTLQNFAGGVMILLFKPFKVGDYIETRGMSGTVKEIQIFSTILNTTDNKRIIIPNSSISSEITTNFSAEKKRRLDLIFSAGYESDIDHVKKTIKDALIINNKILKKPSIKVVLKEMADSSLNFKVMAWVNGPDYWDAYYSSQEAIKKAFDKEKISIPYPHQEVYLHNIKK
jgi:small conductance mechanosensitive channel